MKNKLVVVGTGHVGSTVINAGLALNLFSEIVTIDKNKNKAEGEALDASHSTPFEYNVNTKVYSGGYEECRDADVIIIAAGPSIMPEDKADRLILVEKNVPVIKDVMSSIAKYTKDAVIIIITNPLDVMVYYAQNFFGYPKNKVFGTGTSLDSARFRRIIANKYNVDPKSVQGYMLGEHGNSAFPAWSRLNIAGISYDKLDKYFLPKEPLDRDKVAKEVVQVAFDVLNLKRWTNDGIAMAACRLARAVVLNEHTVQPVSTTLEGEYGLTEVALSLPSIITSEGVERRIEVPLLDEEIEKLRKSAGSIKKTIELANLGK
ncbi:MAG: L-lactate dehydrogenase [Clostridium sp.]|jgi:L-lactate dehydrogenase|uniref:L-lactate dehydrogenase n=1 Tax=Clostridium sp. TaxID=1506 RepID=UPI0025B9DABD|nr:L-lactate dehydrogenase [Clostridium sp.]MCH3964794.1 L-lactate dehydrogenase [Clostridium sp.]MCI1715265.1 L-lactate dehydrogenase [Clostridium sp.]MCI1799527.1 L-lactate dehydrogenase [Clostridium sp.]MCI1813448.1 L-lactate dehydrogenase [Clostridium sp.]MCI1870339.1 L-lactate dehydrogenase [Clostridium sp.]